MLLTYLLLPAAAGAQDSAEAVFEIRTAFLDGSGVETIYRDAYRQATHLRVSPDDQWIMFSRYNERDPNDDLAKEHWGGKNHYENTEIMLMRADGSEVRPLIPAKPGVFAVNSNWIEDGKGFVYVSSDNEKHLPEIRRAYLSDTMLVERTETIKLPEQLVPVDPHLHRGRLAFVAVDLKNMNRGLWIADEDGSNARQLTFPKHPETGRLLKHPHGGDNDPRISPDGSEVAFMRLIDNHALWQVYVLDLASGSERNISAAFLNKSQMDAVPEWSGDGNLLTFWSVDLDEVTFDVVVAQPDGSGRRKVISNPRMFQQSPAFFPGSGSGAKARLAYSTQKVSGWKLRAARLLSWFR